MEKNPNTPSGDELCIKYVMNELDPSEIYMIRKEMEENEDLLIEIECLSRTWGKIKGLPEVEPPPHISEAVVETANQHFESSKRPFLSLGSFNNTSLMASAAAIIFSLSIGIANFYPQLIGFTTGNEGAESASAMEEQIEPWVDNNDVLHLNTSEAGFSASVVDSIARSGVNNLMIFDNQNTLHSPASSNFQLTQSPSQ